MIPILEHPDIGDALRDGYPAWMQEEEEMPEFDEDAAFEERREEDHGW